MAELFEVSRLTYFITRKYEYDKGITFDASCSPRPRFCLALLLEGKATFRDRSGDGESIDIKPGDMIFVPYGIRYVSDWIGAPRVTYITIHFLFDSPGIFSRNKSYKLQKFTPDDFGEMKRKYEFILENQSADEVSQLAVLSMLFEILGTILPHLQTAPQKKLDSRILGAIEYIEKNYTEPIAVDTLAAVANMSASRFYPAFKDALGATPVDYLNHYRVNRAMTLLVNETELSVEEISMRVGFESSTYFRRVFKRITGKTPKDYRKISAEV